MTHLKIIFNIYVYFYLTKVKVKFLVHAMEVCMESKGRDPLILNLGTKWISVVSFTLQPLNHQKKSLVPTELVPESVWLFRREILSLLARSEPRISNPEAK